MWCWAASTAPSAATVNYNREAHQQMTGRTDRSSLVCHESSDNPRVALLPQLPQNARQAVLKGVVLLLDEKTWPH